MENFTVACSLVFNPTVNYTYNNSTGTPDNIKTKTI
jgi:hypothetical protein